MWKKNNKNEGINGLKKYLKIFVKKCILFDFILWILFFFIKKWNIKTLNIPALREAVLIILNMLLFFLLKKTKKIEKYCQKCTQIFFFLLKI